MVACTYSPGSLVFEINDIKNLAIEQLHYAFRSILKTPRPVIHNDFGLLRNSICVHFGFRHGAVMQIGRSLHTCATFTRLPETIHRRGHPSRGMKTTVMEVAMMLLVDRAINMSCKNTAQS